MRHLYYASNGHVASIPCVDSALQDEASRVTPTEIGIQREDATQHGCDDRNLAVELTGIVTAQRAISAQIEVNRIIETLLLLTIEYVGAERALLFLAKGPEVEIEAEATRHTSGVRVVFSQASVTPPKFPQSVLRYVLRSDKGVVLDDASGQNQFSEDEYLSGGRLRSILCLPLITERDLVGVLYLENNLAPNAFALHRLAALELLASQAAISLRTARLWIDLQNEIRQRRKAEEELERIHSMYGEVHLSARAELMGGLAAALAHELNQPLGAIRSNAQAVRRLLGARRPHLEEVRSAIEDIIRDNSRAADTVQNVRAIFRRGAVEMSTINLMEILHDVRRIVRTDAELQGITVHLQVPASLPAVVGNKTQLVQALMNLILNAFEATCDADHDCVREVVISARQRERGRVHVSVRDSGKGVDPEIMPRLFDPFFTTKPNGMGMGLAIVRSIIEDHGGQLWAIRNHDCGLTMEFDLPMKNDGEQ